jgi:hypothetical protein
MHSDIIVLLVAEALKQRLNILVTTAKVVEENAAASRHRVLAVRQLLDEEHAAIADLE